MADILSGWLPATVAIVVFWRTSARSTKEHRRTIAIDGYDTEVHKSLYKLIDESEEFGKELRQAVHHDACRDNVGSYHPGEVQDIDNLANQIDALRRSKLLPILQRIQNTIDFSIQSYWRFQAGPYRGITGFVDYYISEGNNSEIADGYIAQYQSCYDEIVEAISEIIRYCKGCTDSKPPSLSRIERANNKLQNFCRLYSRIIRKNIAESEYGF